MSISGILSSLYNPQQAASSTSSYQQQIQQLSKDLQTGNLSAAQSDFKTLQQAFSQTATSSAPASSSSSSNPIAQAIQQLGSDLNSGNLSAAQQDFAAVQKDVQKDVQQIQNTLAFNHFAHHAHRSGGSADSASNSLLQDLTQSQTQPSTSPAGAQQAYSTLQQQFEQFSLGGGATSTSSEVNALQAQPPLSLVA
jgi:hypothetical protein